MIKYYSWALSEKLLSVLPLGDRLYYFLGSLVNKNKKGAHVSFISSLLLVKKATELTPENGIILDVGTGWFHHESFLLWLTGNYKIILFDIRDNSKLSYIKNYTKNILQNIRNISKELSLDEKSATLKLKKILEMSAKEEIYEYCNFEFLVTKDMEKLKKHENNIDFMLSNCVLNHIPLRILKPELRVLKSLLKPGGLMYFLVGHDDHWSFHDTSANMFNYYRYSDNYYKTFFENKFEFQNRLVKPELDKLFIEAGLKVKEYTPYRTTESLKQIKKLGKIDKRFSGLSDEELSTIWSFYLLGLK